MILKQTFLSKVPDASHDFDKISHDDCDYDSTNGLNIDVDKLLGRGDDNLSDSEYEQFYGDYNPDVEVFSPADL